MTEREMLEWAAVAIGLENLYWGDVSTENLLDHLVISTHEDGRVTTHKWNPLTDDGDALRLAVRLGLDIMRTEMDVEAIAGLPPYAPMERDRPAPFGIESLGDDPLAATRRAIVKAAAEIGRSMSNE